MTSAIASRPYDAFGSSLAAGPSTSYRTSALNSNGSSSSDPQSSAKRAASSARKKAERFLHEKAPGVSTLVAGHPDGLGERTNRLGLPKSSRKSSNKRYSSNEVAHLVPDQDGGDELHDPEYQAIKLVERPPALPSDASDNSSLASSTEDEADEGMEAFSPKNRNALLANTTSIGFSSSSTTVINKHKKRDEPSRSYRTYSNDPAGPGRGDTSLLGVGGPSTSNGRLGQSLRSYATTSGNGGTTKFLRPPSVDTHSTGRSSSRRTFADGPATYLAPSITMPPINSALGEPRPQGYNPYTYIPTTAAPSEVLSHHHSILPNHHSKRHVDFGPSTTYTYDKEDNIAPPIAWQSSFTPSADHPERHRTRIHDENPISNNLKRSIQSIKLDISFGLMRLGKKK